MPGSNVQPHRLIIADSEIVVRSELAEYLRHCGYKVIEAANADEVIAVLEDSAARVSAILIHAGLGGTKNPFELRIWMQEHHPQVHTVLAGSIDTAAKAAGEMCDRGPHLKRPYDPQAVAAHIKRLLADAQK